MSCCHAQNKNDDSWNLNGFQLSHSDKFSSVAKSYHVFVFVTKVLVVTSRIYLEGGLIG